MTIVSVFLIDRTGRKPLLIIGLSGIIANLAIVGTMFKLSEQEMIGKTASGWISLISVLVYVISFAISMGPIPFVVATVNFFT